ncbi:MAG: hypothetical protein KIT72_13090 [Polyangiaceae bacterium]|nr:hypothetical protein [Polyangiaceae bacterium]MCW5791346.1 hypothetical protein [Polyangiaceae bacterium]
MHPATRSLVDGLIPLRQRWPGRGWSWDSRFSCVASSFHVDLEGEALEAVRATFRREWGAHTLNQAPPLIQGLAQLTSGVRAEQRLFSMEPSSGTVAFGLWWPWGDDLTISLRVGLTGALGTEAEAPLCELFNALD